MTAPSAVLSDDPRIIQLLTALASKDPAEIEALCHPDLVLEDPASLPFGGRYKGFAGMCELAGQLFAAIADCRIETLSVMRAASGDEFVLRQRLTGRAARTGRSIETEILEHYVFRDDLIAAIRPFYWDTRELMDLLGESGR